jgi:ion channel-forming bestrophin family protein
VIQYQAKSWLSLLLRWKGTVAPGILLRSLVAAGIGVASVLVWRDQHWALPPVAHGLVGVALGLLLVFRTNASYDRFWEGRKLVGMMVNRSRDLLRQVTTLIEGDDAAAQADRAELLRLVNLLYALIRQYLRKERDLATRGNLITESERAALADVAVRPAVTFTWIGARLTAAVRAGRLTETRLMLMDANLTSFSDSWGGAERIMKTPLPFAYAHHIRVFLTLFVFTAPFAMAQQMSWATPAAAFVLAYGLFGIDEIGVEIEDPFGYDANDLPLDATGDTIAADTAAIARSRS